MTDFGGWKESVGGVITPELRAYFEEAVTGLMGVGYTPVALLATQEANGTNYKFQAIADPISAVGASTEKIVIVNVDPSGKATLVDIED